MTVHLSKELNCREPNTINDSKCKIGCASTIDKCKEKLKTKYKLRGNSLNVWKDFFKQEASRKKIPEKIVTSKILNNENVEMLKPFFIIFKNKLLLHS